MLTARFVGGPANGEVRAMPDSSFQELVFSPVFDKDGTKFGYTVHNYLRDKKPNKAGVWIYRLETP